MDSGLFILTAGTPVGKDDADLRNSLSSLTPAHSVSLGFCSFRSQLVDPSIIAAKVGND